MKPLPVTRRYFASMFAALIVVAGFSLAGLRCATGADQQQPAFDAVKALVQKTLARDAIYQPADLITQSQVAVVLGEIKKAGWEVPNTRDLFARATGQ